MEKDRWLFFKCAAIVIVLFSAIYCLRPLRDQPFDRYIESQAKCRDGKFANILESARKRVSSGESRTLFLALKEAANGSEVDLAEFFPNINLADIKNIKKKNDLLMNVLLRRSQSKIRYGLDLKGGVSCVLKVDHDMSGDNSLLDKAIEIVRQRIDSFGVAEPIVRKSGDNCIEIQLPGVSTKDNPDIIDYIKKPAKLEFRLVNNEVYPKSKFDIAPIGYELLTMEHEDSGSGKAVEVPYFVKKLPEMTGKMVKAARVGVDNFGNFEVGLTMTNEGERLFEKITTNNIDRQFGIVLDGKLYSAPTIRTAIPNGQASISGNFSQREAFELVNVLNNPLEVELKFIELNEIGPSLADGAKSNALLVSLVSALAVGLFMIIYYHCAGIVAVLSIIFNVLIVLGVMAYIGATLTLPGIAALALTIGMAVDSNILIFERVREELNFGKNLKLALSMGYNRAFSTVFDANVTTVIVAGILIWLGVGPIRGFGVILAIGVFATMFCALIFTQVILDFIVNRKIVRSLIPNFHFKPANIKFLQYAKKALHVSFAIITIGVLVALFRGKNILGIDFIGGDEMVMIFDRELPIGEITSVAERSKFGEVLAVYQRPIGDVNKLLKIQTREGKGFDFFNALQKAHPECNLSLVKKSSIGAALGSSVKWHALVSIGLALLCMMVYIAFRFEMAYGIGAVASILLDALVTISIYILCGKQFSAPMVASVLMVIGYSINDKIVIFDRIREEYVAGKGLNLVDVVNSSINHTLSRTLLTSATTLLASLTLCIFGTGVIVDLAFVFTVGIIVGTLSSTFIASPIFIKWHLFEEKRKMIVVN